MEAPPSRVRVREVLLHTITLPPPKGGSSVGAATDVLSDFHQIGSLYCDFHQLKTVLKLNEIEIVCSYFKYPSHFMVSGFLHGVSAVRQHLPSLPPGLRLCPEGPQVLSPLWRGRYRGQGGLRAKGRAGGLRTQKQPGPVAPRSGKPALHPSHARRPSGTQSQEEQ